MLFAHWEIPIVKNCDQGLENAAQGGRSRAAFSSPRSQFFAIQTDPKPANNLFIFFLRKNWLTSGFMQLCHCIGSAYVPSTNYRKNYNVRKSE